MPVVFKIKRTQIQKLLIRFIALINKLVHIWNPFDLYVVACLYE